MRGTKRTRVEVAHGLLGRRAVWLWMMAIMMAVSLGITGLAASLSVSAAEPPDQAGELPQALPLASARAVGPAAIQASPWTPPQPAYRIYVAADGMYRLDYAYLSSAGLPVDSIDPSSFKMYQMGTEIAIQITGNGDALFESGEAVVFYGRSLDSLFYDGLVPTNKYTGTNIYWLSYGGDAGLRMAVKDGSASGATPGPFPHRVHLEANSQYISAYPKQLDADHWYDFKLAPAGATGVRTKSYRFDVQHLITAAPDGLLKVAMLGQLAGGHSLRLNVNGAEVFNQANLWSGFEPITLPVNVLSSHFLTGPTPTQNTIQVQVYNSSGKISDAVYPNWLEVTYYDDYIAEGNALAFENTTAGAWRYQVQGFSSPELEAYDVTDMTAVQRFANTTVGGSGPYDVSFGDSPAATGRYMAVGTGGWLTPARIESVVNRTSVYTPPNLTDTDFGADYIIISHASFWADAQRLAQYRAPRFPGRPRRCAAHLRPVQRRADVGGVDPRLPGVCVRQLDGAQAGLCGPDG